MLTGTIEHSSHQVKPPQGFPAKKAQENSETSRLSCKVLLPPCFLPGISPVSLTWAKATLAAFRHRASVHGERIYFRHSRSFSWSMLQNILIFLTFYRTPRDLCFLFHDFFDTSYFTVGSISLSSFYFLLIWIIYTGFLPLWLL